MKRQFLMPSALGVVLMLCLLTVQSSMLHGLSQSVDVTGTRTDYTYGVPTMLRITDSISDNNGTRAHGVHVYWGTIAIVLAVAWCLSMPIGRWITGYARRNGELAGPGHTGWAEPAAIVGYVLAGCVVVAAIVGVVLDRTMNTGDSLAETIFGLFMMLMILAVPATVIVMIVRRWRYRSRVGQRGFAVEVPAAQV